MIKFKTHYDNLQIAENASPEVVRGAYRHLSQKWHPDKNPHQRAEAERVSKIINEAYRVLSDPDLRREHDKWIAEYKSGGTTSQDQGTDAEGFSKKIYDDLDTKFALAKKAAPWLVICAALVILIVTWLWVSSDVPEFVRRFVKGFSKGENWSERAVGIAGLLVNLFLFYLVCFVSLNSVLEVGVNLARKMLRVDLQNWKGSLRVLEHQRPLVELAAREVLLKRNLRIIRPVYDRENDRWRYEFSLWRAGPLVFIIAGLMATAFQWLGAGAQSPTSTDSKAGRPKVAPAAVNTGGREDIQQPTQSKTQNPVGRESHEIPVTSTKAESAISLTFIDEGGVEYALSKNADGFVLKSSSMTLYLGNSCDAYSPEHGKGRWGWANGRFAIELQNVNFGFPMQSPPFDDLRCRL